MIYASIAAVLVALLAWDGWRRYLLTGDDLDLLRREWDARIVGLGEVFASRNALITAITRIGELESRTAVPVDVSEFRAELDKHERALKNVIADARETFATKAELKTAETSLRSGQGVTATAGNVGNGRMRMPLR